jgi:ABC-type branched-subunit amino acid transport system substrate-binding protein
MFAVFRPARKFRNRPIATVLAMLGLLVLAACEPLPVGGFGGPNVNPGEPVPVALLVPRGSGNSGDDILAQSLENAARLAASDLQGAQIDLRVYNTAGNPQLAAQRATQAVDEGAKIIIGPVYAEAANAAGVAVAARGVNVLSFSNNTGIAGGNVFVLGPTFDNTAQRLVGYAVSQGRNRMVVVHGNDVAGQTGNAAIQRAAAGGGAQIVGTVGYDLSQQGVAAAIPSIESAISTGNANALFMTSTSSGALPLYSSLLPENGITNATTQFIGLTRWDIPAQTLSLPGLQGGWFAMPDPGRTAAFASRYQSAYGAQPHPIGGLGFDAIAAIGALVAQGNRDALTKSALTQANGFQGVGGIFRLLPDGTNQRALAVAVVQGGAPVIVDPAPQSFGGF